MCFLIHQVLLWDSGNLAWCLEAVFFLVAQYVVVYFRVLPYMRNTFGTNSCLTCSFTYLGFPLGLFILDLLMLLEPFGLLAVLPLPAWLKQFVPACTRLDRSSNFPSPLPPFNVSTLILTTARAASPASQTRRHVSSRRLPSRACLRPCSSHTFSSR